MFNFIQLPAIRHCIAGRNLVSQFSNTHCIGAIDAIIPDSICDSALSKRPIESTTNHCLRNAHLTNVRMNKVYRELIDMTPNAVSQATVASPLMLVSNDHTV